MKNTEFGFALFGGPEEIRTPDPYNANVMRSQLRYGPIDYLGIIARRGAVVKRKLAKKPGFRHGCFLMAFPAHFSPARRSAADFFLFISGNLC